MILTMIWCTHLNTLCHVYLRIYRSHMIASRFWQTIPSVAPLKCEIHCMFVLVPSFDHGGQKSDLSTPIRFLQLSCIRVYARPIEQVVLVPSLKPVGVMGAVLQTTWACICSLRQWLGFGSHSLEPVSNKEEDSTRASNSLSDFDYSSMKVSTRTFWAGSPFETSPDRGERH